MDPELERVVEEPKRYVTHLDDKDSGKRYDIRDKEAIHSKEELELSYNDLADAPTFKTINGDSVVGEGNIAVVSNHAFKDSWPIGNQYTTKQFCDVVNGDADAIIGMCYLGTGKWSDKPSGLANGDVKVEILAGPSNTKAIHLTMTNSSVAPYHWEYTYWNNGSESGWRGFQPELKSGTTIKTINNQSILGSGNLVISSGSALPEFPQDLEVGDKVTLILTKKADGTLELSWGRLATVPVEPEEPATTTVEGVVAVGDNGEIRLTALTDNGETISRIVCTYDNE